jgi:hypothetical protein
MTTNTRDAAWLDCSGQDAGEGNVRCTIQLLSGGTREILVPAEHFDARGARLKVRIIRQTKPLTEVSPDCPSQEVGSYGYVVECPTADGEADGRVDVLAVSVEPIFQF